jgi:hypothetical protein
MLKKIITLLSLFCVPQLVVLAETKEYLLDNCDNIKTWGITLGGEFPGAKGSIRQTTSGKLSVHYDFSKGGRYIAIWPRTKFSADINVLCLKLTANQDCRINYRIVDATGRYFQGKAKLLKKSQTTTAAFKSSGPWSGAWGGQKNSSPAKPFKQFFLMIASDNKLQKQGSIQLETFSITSDKELKHDFAGKGADLNACGWSIKTSWLPQLTGGLLKITANSTNAKDATLSINFPQMGRDNVFRKKLSQKNETFYYRPPLKTGGNIYNKYKLILKIANSSGTEAHTILILAGRKSEKINLGAPLNSKKIKSSRFGVCTHFSFGKSPTFSYWAPYKKLINGIAQCGYKWIRDSCSIIKQKNGSYKVRDYDLEWMKYAKGQGLNIIMQIRMYPDKTISEYKKYVAAAVKDTKGLVNVYELGNEPGNFGWKKKFGGHWNGYDPKTKNTEKWVKEHLKYTNALADHMKKLRPDVTVIGVGAASPTNFLALNLGVSKNVDGIVDHPYTYSMPPEKIPFSKNHQKRDGVVVAENGSFEELIKSYISLFKKTGKMRSIWLTEFGFTSFWFSGKNEKGLYAGFTEQTQAVYLVRRFILGLTCPVVAVACQYDFLDDYNGKEFNPEANFGIIRPDHSRKPAFYAIQRMNSLFNGYNIDSNLKVVVDNQPLHRSCKRGLLIKDWDKAAIKADNDVLAYAFTGPENEKMIAVWSAQPYSREFNNRVCTISVAGLSEYNAKPVAIDIITGISYDVPMQMKDGKLVFKNLSLKGHPIVIKLFK